MKILVLTSVYRDETLGNRDTSTNIVNSFVKEWVKQKNDVIVIHNAHQYPKFIHKLPIFLKKKIASIINFQIADFDAVLEKEYIDNGVKIYRCPIKKYIPYKSPSDKRIKKQVNKIKLFLSKNEFKPDIIIGHWISPQIEISYYLKPIYKCKIVTVLHGLGYINDTKFKIQKYINNIDKIGCRSIYQSKIVKNKLKLNYLPFVCYSGIPDEYLKSYKLNLSKYNDINKWKIIYVGRLIAYKNVDAIIKSLALINEVDWELTIIGDGTERKKLEKLVKQKNIEDKVYFTGKIPRDSVMKKLKESNIFVMISNDEVFGLVYLEAMAASCITIASENGGIDGIIINNNNGYLCKQGSVESLKKRLELIFQMSNKNLKKISASAYNTAQKYSDSRIAKYYLNEIKK